MRKTVISLVFGGVMACNLPACSTAATTAAMPGKAEQSASCREAGLTNGNDSRMGQLDCSPRAVSSGAVGK
jgi:hypothetical protein